ncbi:hypothetical protein OA408_00555 [Acidimicrobiaceae bacterium]|nr:hypothetical protein [Acidimicrobiaceae bacterium]
MKIIQKLKNNLTLVFFLPIILNFLINLLRNEIVIIYSFENFVRLTSFLLSSIFFVRLSIFIKKILNISSNSLAITYFLTSYYLFDLLFLFLTQNFSSRLTFYFVSVFWIFLLASRLSKAEVFQLFITYFVMRLYHFFNFRHLSNNPNYLDLNTDVEVQWLPLAKMIYENNYFYGLENNLIEGQSLFLTYLQGLIMRINFDVNTFQFIQTNSYLLLTLSFLFIFDLEINNKNKIISIVTLATLLMNNDWLYYLLINSLMLEGLLNFLVATYFINLKNNLKVKSVDSKLFFFFFGTLALTKQFISLSFLILLVVFLIFIKQRMVTLIGLVPYFLDSIYKYIYLQNSNFVTYTSDLSYTDLILDFILIRDLEFTNVIKIIKNFYIDKPLSLLFMYFFLVLFYTILKLRNLDKYQTISVCFIILNILFVFLLYLSYWKNIEINSSYRYIVNIFYLVYVFIISSFDSFEKIK